MSKKFWVHPLNTEEPYISTYKEYIKSPEWRMRAIWLKKKTDFTCERCGHSIAADLDAHHKHYRTLGRETKDDIEILCRRCHKEQHER